MRNLLAGGGTSLPDLWSGSYQNAVHTRASAGTAVNAVCSPAPQMMPVQRYPGPLSFRKQKPFTQADLCTVLGFTSAIMGCFWGSVLLLPLGLVTSVLGYRRDRTKGLAVAGIVISVIGLLIKVVSILSQAVYLPPWFTNGIW